MAVSFHCKAAALPFARKCDETPRRFPRPRVRAPMLVAGVGVPALASLRVTKTGSSRDSNTRVVLARPSVHPPRRALVPPPVWAVLAQQRDAPAGGPPRSGLLRTTRPLAGPADAVQAVRWYSRRWLSARSHDPRKRGCRREALPLATAARTGGVVVGGAGPGGARGAGAAVRGGRGGEADGAAGGALGSAAGGLPGSARGRRARGAGAVARLATPASDGHGVAVGGSTVATSGRCG